MVTNEMTDQQLSERVCKALGIKPLDGLFFRSGNGQVMEYGADPRDFDAWLCFADRERVEPHYPNVLEWSGFGLAVEKLREVGLNFTLNDLPADGYMAQLYPAADIAQGVADTLPRALALAVLEWAVTRGVE